MKTLEITPVQSETKASKTNESIWTMQKAELVEVARRELGLTLMAAQKETVPTLRERIRNQRMATTIEDSPLRIKPKGLSKMTLQELKDEAETRNIPLPKPSTRGKLLVLINDDLYIRQTFWEQRESWE